VTDNADMQSAISTQDLTIPARDGFDLAATEYRPADPAGVVLINSATAVPRRFYRHIATELARSGYTAITYDYRGIGQSRPATLRGFDARIRDWALNDISGVIDWATNTMQPAALFMLGHSVGGQIAGLIDNPDRIDGLVTVSSQSGYWAIQGGEQKWVVGFHTHVTLPLFAHTLGFVPWSRIGSAEDLPGPAALEWSRWCRHPDYLLGDASLPLERYKRFDAPVLALCIDDDKWGTRPAVERMMRAYPNVEFSDVAAGDAGLRSLGHFGYFRADASSLWPEVIDWLSKLRDSSQLRASSESDSNHADVEPSRNE